MSDKYGVLGIERITAVQRTFNMQRAAPVSASATAGRFAPRLIQTMTELLKLPSPPLDTRHEDICHVNHKKKAKNYYVYLNDGNSIYEIQMIVISMLVSQK